MKVINWLMIAVATLSANIAVAAPTVGFVQGGNAVSGTVIENFDSFGDGASIGSDAFAHAAPSGSAARPAFGSTGNFAAVHAGGSYSIAFTPTSLLSFVVGSLDTYNTLTLAFADGTSTAYVGSQITGGGQADGNQIVGATNGVVSYATGSGPLITSASFTSGANSFEFDNIAVGVPEPATWALMIGGFGVVGAAMRRRSLQVSFA